MFNVVDFKFFDFVRFKFFGMECPTRLTQGFFLCCPFSNELIGNAFEPHLLIPHKHTHIKFFYLSTVYLILFFVTGAVVDQIEKGVSIAGGV